ncbi:zinc finger, RING/FYVE/PHD-type [Artemisia annua]|uniref:Zinc finger, RING/FYVE/PHD-type n=1 Tax=Artemisia annua TaxID=35608 RepID=A0A2U1QA41_ARTAN|nr:zinc finger, RING/FYVE/PHD-type [Artemisia annua]
MEKEENHKSIEANNEYKQQDQEQADMDLNLDGEISPNKRKRGERDDLDLCSICLKPWTSVHQMSCLPCGHIFGMSCIKEWMEGRSSYRCPECFIYFSLKSVRLLSATRLCIPADQKADVLARQKDAMKRRTELLNRRANAQQQAEALRCLADAEKLAEALQCRADEYLRKADAFGQQAKASRQ